MSRGGWWGVVLPLVVVAGFVLAVLGASPRSTAPSPSAPAGGPLFVPTVQRLPPLPEGHYELWVERPDGATEPLATFSVLPSGQLVTLNGEPARWFPVAELPPQGSTILLLVEAGREPAIERGERVLLRGTVSVTDVRFTSALPSTAGRHVALLDAPTDPKAPETSGLWFAQSVSRKTSVASGLSLPPPGPGWMYGAFVTTAGGTVLPVGTFTDVGAADAFAPYSGEQDGWSVPGEDFVLRPPSGVTFPLLLADGRTTVVVSLLPDFLRESAEPYLPLLIGRIPFGQPVRQPFALEPVAPDTLPTGSGTFTEKGS